MTKTAPCELGDGEVGTSYGFDKDFLNTFGFLSGLIVPLIMRTRTIGAIFLQDCKMPRPWSIDDLTFSAHLPTIFLSPLKMPICTKRKKCRQSRMVSRAFPTGAILMIAFTKSSKEPVAMQSQ